ncbi:hypothetical protein [Euzebya sp.]|uniref:hypothetical protein n=1 Tax=Euzebya sp. TaxID=1971409 RepID=UPI003517832E
MTAVPSDLIATTDQPWDADTAWGTDIAYAPPLCSPTTLAIYDWVGPAMRGDDAAHGWAYLAVISALAEPLWEIEKIARARDGRVGYAAVFDPDTVPAYALGWYEMTVGLTPAPWLPTDRRRERMKNSPAYIRGGRAAMLAEVRLTLDATRLVHLVERTGIDDQYLDKPFRQLVQTFAAQTPDPDATTAAVQAAKPGPDIVDYRVIPGQTCGQLAALELSCGEVEAAYADCDDVATTLPDEELL